MGFLHDIRQRIAREAMASVAPRGPQIMLFTDGDSSQSDAHAAPRRPRKNKLAGNAARKVRGKNEHVRGCVRACACICACVR